MEKAQYVIGEDSVRVTIPIVKSNIDELRRIVSGWATIDNIDQTGDLVTADASLDAFKGFRGNVREMHDDKKAVGRIVHFEQKEYTDAHGEVHKGIYVDVYVSKGAEDTWQKVLDGTLSAFSIKGPIRNAGMVKSIDTDSLVRVITKYDLIELSLVDNPGNELCDVISVEKSNEGIAANVTLDNVFWCENDKIAISHEDEIQKCVMCGGEMENIGWFEPSEDEAPNDSITKVLQAANKLEKTLDITKGGSNSEMSDEVKTEESKTEEVTEEVAEVTEEVKTDEGEKVEATAEEVSEDVVTAEEPDLVSIGKALTEIQTALSESTVKTREETVAEIQKAVSAVEQSVDARLSELLEKHSALETEVKSFKDGLGSVEKKLSDVLGTVEKASAIQKSLTTESGDLQKSKSQEFTWSGRFLPNSYDQD